MDVKIKTTFCSLESSFKWVMFVFLPRTDEQVSLKRSLTSLLALRRANVFNEFFARQVLRYIYGRKQFHDNFVPTKQCSQKDEKRKNCLRYHT